MTLVAALAGVWLYFHLAPPGSVFKAYNTDPELAYFVDSLAPFKGQPYRGVEHPGTPLTLLGTVLLSALYPFSRSSGAQFVAESIRRPEPFFVLAHATLAAANVACIAALSRCVLAVRRLPDAVLAAAIPASFFAFLPDAFFWPLYWSHNAMAFPAGAAILLALMVALRRGRPLPNRTIAVLGMAAGLLAATQIYFATWVLGLGVAAAAVERLGPRKAWALRPLVMAPAAAALGFALGLLPAAGKIPRFFAFARRIFLHQGYYGAGPSGFTSPAVWTANVARLVGSAPWLFAATAVAFALLLAFFLQARLRGPREAGLWAAALGVSVQWLATLALFGKHGGRLYLPALAAMLSVLLALAFALARRRGRAARLACLVVAVASLAGSAHAAVVAVRDHTRRVTFRAAMDEEVARFRASFVGDRGLPGAASTLLLWGPGLPDTGCYALWGVNLYLEDAFRGEISALCPSDGLAWSNSVALPNGWSSLQPFTALLVTTEDAPVRFPAFAALGEPTLSIVRDPNGQRLAFYRVTVRDGRAHRARP